MIDVERGDAAGVRDRADGLRPSPAQPDLLADGSVLATGGNSTGASLVDMNGGVYNAERWNPATGKWTTLAAQAVTRQYHSTALLLPDGRVLSAGGGICGTCDQVGYLAKNAEFFTPPYLFKHDGSGELAPRPEIDAAPGTVSHGRRSRSARRTPLRSTKVGLCGWRRRRTRSKWSSATCRSLHGRRRHAHGDRAREREHRAVPGFYMLFIVDSPASPRWPGWLA